MTNKDTLQVKQPTTSFDYNMKDYNIKDYNMKDYNMKDYNMKGYNMKDYNMKDYNMKDYNMTETFAEGYLYKYTFPVCFAISI